MMRAFRNLPVGEGKSSVISRFHQPQILVLPANMKHPVLPRIFYLYLGMALFLPSYLSGCAVKNQEAEARREQTPLAQIERKVFQNQLDDQLKKIARLEHENRVFIDQSSEQKNLIAELQIKVLKQHKEADNYLQLTERLAGELARSNTEPPERGKQIETTKLVAEVIEVIIGTMKMHKLDSTQKDLLYWAEQYLAESKIEIDRENAEGASYLCRQAMEQVHQFTLYTSTHREQKNTAGTTFLSPVPMKLLKKSNLRAAPSTKAKVIKTLAAGSQVSALGYKGTWVHVSLAEQGDTTGWIYYSLLR